MILAFLLLMTGCAKKDSSEAVLKSFIGDFFSQKMTKSRYLDYLAGPLYERIEPMSDDEFDNFISGDDFKMRKFKILLKSCNGDQCNLTYILKYVQNTSSKNKYLVDVKKIARLDKIDGDWKIVSITNAKTFIDSKNVIQITK